MRRRDFIILISGAGAAWPIAALAQQPAMPAIGFLSAGGAPLSTTLASFVKGLGEMGFFEARNVAIVVRSAEQYDQLPSLIAEFIRMPVSVIHTSGGANSALAAKAATSTIPIVFAHGGDPVQLGLVASMNRPGGNVTGVTFFSADLATKRLELLRELVPSAGLIAFLVNAANELAEADVSDMQAAAATVGREIMVVRTSSVPELDDAFAMIAQRQAGAVLVAGDPFLGRRPDYLASLAPRYRIPASYPNRSYVNAGGLMGYGDARSETYRQAGNYVGRILKGEKPAEMPVVQPTKFEFVINLKTAKALGITFPPSFHLRADEVIE